VDDKPTALSLESEEMSRCGMNAEGRRHCRVGPADECGTILWNLTEKIVFATSGGSELRTTEGKYPQITKVKPISSYGH
jgi:hypothetical protein